MVEKIFPLDKEKVIEISKKYETPFYLYDKKAIIDNLRKLKSSFDWVEFKEYFAVKGLPNPSILKFLKEEGCGTDCSSMAELVLSERVGITNEDIMFTSNETPLVEYEKALELGAIINFDDISHLDFFEENNLTFPEIGCFRYNPGSLKKGNAIIGDPKNAKYGLTREQLFLGYKRLKEKGVKRFGIHTMVASNELNEEYFSETAKILFELIFDISKELDIEFEFVNLGGGFGIPYKPEESPLNIEKISNDIKKEYEDIIVKNKLKKPKIFLELARFITGPYGYLITKAIHKKEIYKNYIGVDSCMANLMRPAIYGAYHHIIVLGKENEEKNNTYDIIGSLCENNDKFAIDRKLPKIERGDFLVIFDCGAHGYAMGFNYNGKLKCKELLLEEDGSVKLIRRAETLDDLFSTLNFEE